MQKTTNFNAIAPYYDMLSRVVFGGEIKKAQMEAIKCIQPNSAILIIGGGTGWILEEMAKKHPSGLHITYVDISSKMIEQSKRRKVSLNDVVYLHNSIQNLSLKNEHYDVVITPFILDCFAESTLPSIISKINASIKINGLWLNIDFWLTEKSTFWQKKMVNFMYIFFRFTCHIEATNLPHFPVYFTSYILKEKKMFCNNFITLQVFQKK